MFKVTIALIRACNLYAEAHGLKDLVCDEADPLPVLARKIDRAYWSTQRHPTREYGAGLAYAYERARKIAESI